MSFAATLPRRLPFFYGWAILFAVCCAGFSRQGGAVATLSVFVEPMTTHFGWSRTAMSGAVSLGGVLAALVTPRLGRLLDRTGARLVLCAAVLTTGAADLLLSLTPSLPIFYLLFCVARLNFAGPFDLGIYGALNAWFIRRRAMVTAIASTAQMSGLVFLPLIAATAMAHGGWRAGWLGVGAAVVVTGFLPSFLLLIRSPEDVGLLPDGAPPTQAGPADANKSPEPQFTRAEALRTPAFWLLTLFTLFAYPVQAGVSLHQAPMLIEHGLSPAIAASVVSTFSLFSGCGSLACGFFPRRLPIRYVLTLIGAFQAAGTLTMLTIASPGRAFLAASLFGFGIGGLLTLLPVVWAEYYGRRSFGAVRGYALAGQVLAQAAGPLLSGILRDATGSYTVSLITFATFSVLAVVASLLARPPKPVPQLTV